MVAAASDRDQDNDFNPRWREENGWATGNSNAVVGIKWAFWARSSSEHSYFFNYVSPVNVILAIGGQVVVDYEGDLLHVDASGEKVGSDEDAGRTGAELAHNHVPLLLVHIAVLGGVGGEVAR